MPKPKPIIGLAGGIGAGKSTVARQMRELGAMVIDADALAKEALDLPEIRRQMVAWWGPDVLDAEGRVDRSRVAQRVFDAPDQRKRLEALIHPLVRAERAKLIEQAQADPQVRLIVLDVPLLFEVGADAECDRVVFIDADRQTRLRRLKRDRGWDESELRRREKNQWPLDRKIKLAQDIIDNSKGEAECLAQVRDLLNRLLHTN